jgi:endoglucanase
MDRIECILKELTEAFGPSGFEDSVRKIMRRELLGLSDTITTDGIGSLIAQLPGSKANPRIMLAAHMDEVGLMVKYITADGFVKFQQLGGWLDQSLLGQRWRIMTGKQEVIGVTGVKTPHVMGAEERRNGLKLDNLFIDIGATSQKDAEDRLGIRPGDPIVPVSEFARLDEGRLYLGKAWDDRVGLAVILEVARALNNNHPPNTVYAIGTVQEEVGLRGARTSSYVVKPDIGINIEAGVAGDYPGITKDEAQERLGGGPTIFLHDSMMLPNVNLRNLVETVAKANNITVQFNVLKGYGEDGAEIQRSRTGTPTVNIAIPTRYLHSHNGIINRSDFDSAVRLVTAVIHSLDSDVCDSLTSFD